MNLAQLLQQTDSFDPQIRTQAENQLIQARDANPELFLVACLDELSNKNSGDMSRYKAGILAKTILRNNNEENQNAWLTISQEKKHQLKRNLLSLLISNSNYIQRVSADLISLIWKMEFPLNEWEDLLPALSANSTHTDITVKRAVAIMLEKIIGSMKEMGAPFPKEAINQVLVGVYNTLQDNEDPEVRLCSIESFTQIMPMTKEIFEDQKVREFYFETIIRLGTIDDTRIKLAAMQCFVELVRTFYDYLADSLKSIWEITLKLVTAREGELVFSGLDVWKMIAWEYQERMSNPKARISGSNGSEMVLQMIEAMVPILLQSLPDRIQKEYNDDDYGEISITNQTKDCLFAVSNVLGEIFLQHAIQFLEVYIISTNPIEVNAALIAFSCMLENSCKELLYPIVSTTLPVVKNIITLSKEIKVKEEATYALWKTAEAFPEVFFEQPFASEIIPLLYSLVNSSPRIAVNVVKTWHLIAIKMATMPNENFDNIPSLIEILLDYTFKDEDESGLRDSSFLAAQSLITCLRTHSLKIKYIDIVVEKIKHLDDFPYYEKSSVLHYCLLLLQTCLLSLKLEGFINSPLCETIFHLVKEVLNSYGENEGEGINVLGSLASAMGTVFTKYFDEAWPLLANRLRRSDEPEIFTAALSAIVEFATACPDKLGSHLQEIFSNMDSLLKKDKNCKEDTKLGIIKYTGKIVYGCQGTAIKIISSALSIYEIAMNTCLVLPQEGEDQTELRQITIESLADLFQIRLQSFDLADALFKFLPKLNLFLATVCKNEYNPTEDFVRRALNLLKHINITYADNIQNIDFRRNIIKDIEDLQINIIKLSQTPISNESGP